MATGFHSGGRLYANNSNRQGHRPPRWRLQRSRQELELASIKADSGNRTAISTDEQYSNGYDIIFTSVAGGHSTRTFEQNPQMALLLPELERS
jgi:hypothetical protein